jgi:uncharacterized protein (DUF58 family)
MDTAELLKKIRKIEIKTRGLSSQVFSGEYHSAFKGRGMAFSEVREYNAGDDIRTIDWNVTARFNHPFIKVFEEERELNVMLIVDVSASENFGTNKQLKKELITEICAVLAFSAIQNNDKTGVILFSDKIEKFIPPKKGKSHILRIIRELITYKPESKKTDISQAMRYFSNVIKKRSIAFVISDFLDKDFTDAMKIANKKHDIVAIRTSDKHEQSLPNIGLAQMKDNETGEIKWIDTSSSLVQKKFANEHKKFEAWINETFNRCGIDAVSIKTGEPYIIPLMNLFKMREAR